MSYPRWYTPRAKWRWHEEKRDAGWIAAAIFAALLFSELLTRYAQ